MKKITIIFLVGLLTQRITQAQETVYLSNLGQAPTGSNAVGSDSWDAVSFHTGNNVSGYSLDSIQLGLTNATGVPSGFTVSIYSAIFGLGATPGSSLGTLDGSLSPTTGGLYTYTPDSSLTLSPGTDYFIVLTAGTTVATGAYEWNLTVPNVLIGNGSWEAGGVWKSSNGSTWLYSSGISQFAITAEPIPEPGSLVLFGLSSLLFIRHRRKATAV